MEKREWIKPDELSGRAWAKRMGVIFCEAVISALAAVLAIVNGLQGDPENRVFTCGRSLCGRRTFWKGFSGTVFPFRSTWLT